MKRKWLFGGTLAVGIVAMGLSSAALADDRYCTRRSQQNAYADPRQDAYVDRYADYGNEAYGSGHPYVPSDEGRYSREGRYGSPYDGYPDTQYRHSRPDSRYGRDDSGYGRDGYRGRGYGSGVVHEDHIRSTFRLFPFPHVDKTIVHHAHPTYDY